MSATISQIAAGFPLADTEGHKKEQNYSHLATKPSQIEGFYVSRAHLRKGPNLVRMEAGRWPTERPVKPGKWHLSNIKDSEEVN